MADGEVRQQQQGELQNDDAENPHPIIHLDHGLHPVGYRIACNRDNDTQYQVGRYFPKYLF